MTDICTHGPECPYPECDDGSPKPPVFAEREITPEDFLRIQRQRADAAWLCCYSVERLFAGVFRIPTADHTGWAVFVQAGNDWEGAVYPTQAEAEALFRHVVASSL